MAYLIYLLLAAMSFYCLAQAWQSRRFSVHDGFVLGGLYFFLMPVLLTAVMGPIEAEGLPVAAFTGRRLDIAIFAALCTLPMLAYAMLPALDEIRPHMGMGKLKFYFWLSMLTIGVVFILSGKSEGRHWADSATTDSPIANVMSVVLLVMRTYMFAVGALVMRQNRQALAYLLIYTLVDIFLTGNRISALYLAVTVLLSGAFSIRKLMLPALLLSGPAVLFLSLYPAFRGVLWSEFGGFSGVWQAALYVTSTYDFSSLSDKFIWYFFEAANTNVFQYLFDTYGHARDLLDGDTVLVKPLSLFIPRELWPDKPEGLGIRLGPEIAGVQGLSLNSLLLGEFWVNFGWFAPLAVVSVMLLVYALYRWGPLLRRSDIARFGFLLGFASWRHEFNYFVFSTIAGCLLILVLDPIASHFDRAPESAT